MADTKITQLQPPQVGYPVVPATDVLPIVVIADPGMATSGSTRKVTVNQILGAGGTATLASATITGDLTVRTNKLAVTSTGVGCGTATPGTSLEVWKDLIRVNSDAASGVYGTQFWRSGVERGRYGFDFSASLLELQADGDIRFLTGGETERYRIDSTGVSTWSVAGTTAMTLNASGLGVGTSVQYARLTSSGSNSTGIANIQNSPFASNANTNLSCYIGHDGTANRPFIQAATGNTGNAFDLLIQPYGGNVGIGVTPSYKLDVLGTGNSGILAVTTNAQVSSLRLRQTQNLGANTRNWEIRTNAVAYGNLEFAVGASQQSDTYTAAMTLDASGRLLVGSTSAFTDLTGSKEVKIGDGGMQTLTVASLPAATATNIARGGVGGLVYVGGFNGTGQYGAVVLWTAASATVVSVINGTGSTITFGVSAGFLQITSSLALTSVVANCIRI